MPCHIIQSPHFGPAQMAPILGGLLSCISPDLSQAIRKQLVAIRMSSDIADLQGSWTVCVALSLVTCMPPTFEIGQIMHFSGLQFESPDGLPITILAQASSSDSRLKHASQLVSLNHNLLVQSLLSPSNKYKIAHLVTLSSCAPVAPWKGQRSEIQDV